MANKTVYLRSSGGETVAYEDQVTAGLWHIPPKATEEKPPSFNVKTQTCKFIGDAWVVADIPVPEVIPEPEKMTAMEEFKAVRANELFNTDWWGVSDQSVMTEEQKTYRQQLRDLPLTASPKFDDKGKLTGVIWPSKPE